MIRNKEPIACPRPRVTRSGRVYYPVRYQNWIKDMRERLQDLHVPEGALFVDLVFVIKRPKRLRKGDRQYHDRRPDVDNMVKSVLDVLPIDDDARVVKITASKYYAAYGEDPKIELSIRSAEIKKSLD